MQVGMPLAEAPLALPPQLMYSVSMTFHAEFMFDSQKPDAILVTSDRILFHAHAAHLVETSRNGFNSLLSFATIGSTMGAPVIITVAENSAL